MAVTVLDVPSGTMRVMSEAYWQAVMKTGRSVPIDRSLQESTVELVEMLGHPHRTMREEIAYPMLTTWIADGVFDDLLAGFGDGISTGLTHGLGNVGDLTVFRRSYSALLLSEIINRDNLRHLMSLAALLHWGDRATHWYVKEEDQRGWVEDYGWAHAMAHGADLLAALARSRHFGHHELTVVLDVVADRLLRPSSVAWRHGEHDRLALATMTILHRGVLEIEAVEAWLNRLGNGMRPPRSTARSGGEWPLPHVHNTAMFLRALHLQLALGVQGRPDLASDALLFSEPPPHRSDLLLAVIERIRAESPWLFRHGVGRQHSPAH